MRRFIAPCGPMSSWELESNVCRTHHTNEEQQGWLQLIAMLVGFTRLIGRAAGVRWLGALWPVAAWPCEQCRTIIHVLQCPACTGEFESNFRQTYHKNEEHQCWFQLVVLQFGFTRFIGRGAAQGQGWRGWYWMEDSGASVRARAAFQANESQGLRDGQYASK